MTSRLPALGLVAGLSLLLTACPDDNDAAEPDNDEVGNGDVAAEVAISGNAFDPSDVEIGVGGTVRWTNEDGVAHTATFDDVDSGSLEPGDTFEHTFDETGVHDYVCTFHPTMTGTVTVAD